MKQVSVMIHMECPLESLPLAQRHRFISELAKLLEIKPSDIINPTFTSGCSIFRAQLGSTKWEVFCHIFENYSRDSTIPKGKSGQDTVAYFTFFRDFHISIIRTEKET